MGRNRGQREERCFSSLFGTTAQPALCGWNNTSWFHTVLWPNSSTSCGLSRGMRMTEWSTVVLVTWLPKSFPGALSQGPRFSRPDPRPTSSPTSKALPHGCLGFLPSWWLVSMKEPWKKQRWRLEVPKTQPQSSCTPSLLVAIGQIWAPAQTPGKAKQTLLLDGTVTRSLCKGACRWVVLFRSLKTQCAARGIWGTTASFSQKGWNYSKKKQVIKTQQQ